MSSPLYGAVILAAGASTRLGSPKGLLPYHNSTLLEHAVQATVEFGPALWCVVTGAHDKAIRKAQPKLEENIIHNANWREGIASSIRSGLGFLLMQDVRLEGVFFLVCDQPFISARLLKKMAEAKDNSGKSIVACSYEETLGTPVLFTSPHYPALAMLKGDKGAKRYIFAHPHEVASVHFLKGEIDIDTAQDYARLVETD